MVQLQAAIKDKTNQIKYQVEYRMRMKDNQYQWFRASAEVIRRLDGSASRIAGIFIDIDGEKKEIMQAQICFPPGFYESRFVRVLCESGSEYF